jgi:hypothetical protein
MKGYQIPLIRLYVLSCAAGRHRRTKSFPAENSADATCLIEAMLPDGADLSGPLRRV